MKVDFYKIYETTNPKRFLGRKGGFANRSASPSGSVIVKFFFVVFAWFGNISRPGFPSVNDPATKDVQLGTSFANPQSSKFRVATSLYRTISSVCVRFCACCRPVRSFGVRDRYKSGRNYVRRFGPTFYRWGADALAHPTGYDPQNRRSTANSSGRWIIAVAGTADDVCQG